MASPKVQLENSSTPTEKIISKEKALLEDHVIDSDGKVYKLKIPDVLDQFDLTHALGDDSSNITLTSMALPLLYIKSIDNVDLSIPRSYNEIRAAIKRLGNNGMQAVVGAIERYGIRKQEIEREAKDEIKK